MPSQAWAAPPGDRSGVTLPGLQKDLKVKLNQVAAAQMNDWEPTPVALPPKYEPNAVTLPTPASEPVPLSGSELVQVPNMPVKIGKGTGASSDPSGNWTVTLDSREASEAADIDGALIVVTPPADGTAVTPVDVQLDYTKFKDIYGTGWASRLKFRQLPTCFLEKPVQEGCSPADAKDVPSTNDPSTGTVKATVDPGSSFGQGLRTMAVTGGGGPVVLAASDGGSGMAGSYKASSLSPSGSWTAGNSGGGFSWTYPLTVPAPPAGPTPKIAFSYSSQAVDGKTSVANSQASWIGDGWDYEPGYVERRYRSCSDDVEANPTGANNNNATDKKKGDLCWAGDNVVMSLGGSTTELVHDASGKWIPANDDGSRVELKTDAGESNGARGGEHWVVTTRDGTRYFFGRHDVDGSAGSRPGTDSVLTVPVYGNHPGEPCYTQTFADSSCSKQTAWRWNLDYVEDVHGNAMIIDWAREDGRYAKNEKFKAPVTYHRAGYPTQISYGLRNTNLSAAPAAKIEFTVDERCLKEGACAPAKFESKNYGDKQYWWDTPSTLHCKTGSDCYVSSPTFWTRKRLTAVTTKAQRTEGSTDLLFVDRWSLAHYFPEQRTDTSPPLWLESILRTGYSTEKNTAGAQLSESLPLVSFRPNGKDMPNRVKDGASDPRPDFDRLRIENIATETGGDIHVTYSEPCSPTEPRPQPEANTSRCYPVRWSPDSALENPPLAWFNKYVVTQVTEKDRVALQPDVTTTYDYEGGAAWAKDTDEFSKPTMRTYSQWRGYASVVTTRGVTTPGYEATQQSQSRARYFRGMSGDAGRAKVTVKDSNGTDIAEDYPQYQGIAAETTTYTKAGGSPLSRTVTYPWHEKSGERARPGNTTLYAYRSGTARTDQIQWLSNGSTRTVRKRNTFDKTYDPQFDTSYGLIQAVQSEVATPNGTGGEQLSDQTCASTTYVHNTTAHVIGLAAGVRTTAGACSQKATGALISDTRNSYDALNAFGAAPSKGLLYQADTNDGAGTGWITTARTEYDTLGRPTKATDAANNPVTTVYSPPTGPAYTVTSTNALGHTSTTKNDPGRGVPVEEADANGRKVTTAYDALGRATAVWTPSQKPGTDDAAHTFAYEIKEHTPPTITTATLQDDGTYKQSIEIYDGLLRPRQTQTDALGGGRLITDTLYNANGTVRRTNNSYLADNKPEKKIFIPESDTAVPNSTKVSYDGAGRTLRTTTFHAGDAKDSSTVEYGGEWTRSRTGMSPDGTTPLKGSRAVKTTTDALGRTTQVEHYTTTNVNGASNKTSYTYDQRNKLTKVTDTTNINTWSYTYDARGRMTASDDPDTGRTTFTYNNLDQQTSVTNSAGQAQFTTYDVLGRKTELRDNSIAGPKVATWTYDTLPNAKGQAVASIRWVGDTPLTSEVTGYDSEYRPTGSKITIPEITGTSDFPGTKGLAGTYTYSTTYTPTGKVQSTTLPATPGGLAAEKLITRYNADGMPQTMSGLAWYTAETIYSPFGEVLRTASGSAPNRVWTTNSFNPNTGRLSSSENHRETAPNLLSATTYTYDAVGNPTSITDTRPGADAQLPPNPDRQCFTYDALGQLVKAWTGKTGTCTEPTDLDPTHATAGPDGDGYWQEYQFDAIGNRTQLLDKDPSNGSTREKTTYTYGIDIGGGNKKQPHALAQAAKTTTKPGLTVNSLTTYAYDTLGNTTTRRIDGDTQTLTWDPRSKLTSASSPGIGAVAVTGLAGKCLDVDSTATPNAAGALPVQLLTCNESKAQQWRLTGGTVQALGKCLTAEGGEAVLKPCDPADDAQKFTHRADKTLYSTKAQACVTVPNDNPAEGNDLDIYTCVAGAAAQQWTFANTGTQYLYDASGNRLVEETGSSRTLYLGEAEITVNKAGQAMDAVRYYSSPGAPTTVRRTNGKTTGHSLSAQLTDHHNTATTSVEQATGQTVTRRKSDPYGNPRGTQPGNWPGSRSFLGTGNDDNTTALTHIGAREYEPATGRFMSVDPVIDITDPLQMNGYTYSNGNPISNADPSGLKYFAGHDDPGFQSSPQNVVQAAERYVRGYGSTKGNGGGPKNKGKDCGIFSKCNLKKTVKSVNKFWNENKVMIVSITTEIVVGTACVATAAATGVATGGAGFALAVGCGALAGAAGAAVANMMDDKADHSTMGVLSDMAEGALWGAAGGAAGAAAAPILKAAGGALRAAASKIRPGGGSCPIANSFATGTFVLMADGTSKPIEELEIGEQVLATDPETGETVARDVTATILGTGSKDLVEIKVDTDGDPDTAPDLITATDKHPFWVISLAKWVDAAELQPGQWLRTGNGTHVQVASVRKWATQKTTVHNLTVSDLHTYYVLAGATPVLVHNCGGIEKAAKSAADSAPADATMSAAARFRGTKLIATGHSGHSSRPAFYEPEIDSALADGGQIAGRGADNCAEIRACNALIAIHGADFEAAVKRPLQLTDIEFLTVRSSTGAPEAACLSCQSVLVRRGATDLSR
ncbi:ricin-type beta-trefoil lectin domain protein [Streptomyces yangpuensis]|uniref:ricin-type beta-trefoil lectin domain protein n=1 Tax=Streptomyces yangpuensis TaxID=1648182 RepID=UPI001F333D59|nr:ricin-type beta-trefoil lectin domain protein [Streptomyces yangpuensis]